MRLGALLLALLSAACGQAAGSAPAAPAAVTVLSTDPPVVEVRIGSDDSMRFDVESFEVPAGAEVRLTFSNHALRPMLHNWVLVRRGTEERVAQLGLLAGFEHDWVPADPAVVVATPALRPGSESALVFAAPEPGVHPYLCSVPGHGAMRGRMTVRTAEPPRRR